MDKQRNYSQPQGEVIGYKVDVVNGELVEIPIYEQRLEPATIRASHEDSSPREEPPRPERATRGPRKFRGQSLATASIVFAGLAGITYAADAASTYVQHRKLISPADAYKDFTELPHLVGPFVDTVQQIIRITNQD